jgi:hypothetical protein
MKDIKEDLGIKSLRKSLINSIDVSVTTPEKYFNHRNMLKEMLGRLEDRRCFLLEELNAEKDTLKDKIGELNNLEDAYGKFTED